MMSINDTDGTITFKNDDHLLYPDQKTEFIKIEYLDVRANYFLEGDMVEKSKAMQLVKAGLAKLKIIPKSEQPKEIVKCRWLNRAVRRSYENGVSHMERQKAERLQTEGHLRIIKEYQE
jgi:hypothetical protein